jgi:hypothetical protein
MKSPHPDPLESWVDRALHEMPEASAPSSLSLRVEAVLARRAARAWWQRSPASWPVALRLTMIGVPVAAALLVGPLPAALVAFERQLDLLRVLATALRQTVAALWQQVPSFWLLLAGLVFSLAVSVSFGLGLAARRLLAPVR